jgi:hypothetical protein
MRRHLSVIVLVLVVCAAASLFAQQVRGQVVNRDGVGQRCQVEFFVGADRRFGVVTDNQGYFYLNTPPFGDYRAVLSQGQARTEIAVKIGPSGLSPSTLVARW